MIDVSTTMAHVGRVIPDAPDYEHRDAAVRLIVAYDGYEASISRVLSVLERVANRRA